jgi:predicted esterase
MESDGPVPVGTRNAIGVTSAHDLAGNVREWVSTSSGDNRHLAGGAWNDPGYAIRDQVVASPWVRLPTDGFRCALYPEGSLSDALLRSIQLPAQDLTSFTAMPDAVFDATKSLYAYDRSRPLADRVDSTFVSHTGAIIEWVSIDAAYGGRMAMRLHIPNDVDPPYGAVVFFPGSNLLASRQIGVPQLTFLTRAGRVLVEPIFDGGFNRNDGTTMQRLQSPAASTELLSHWGQDLGRAIDYLEQRPDVDENAIAYAGLSLGAAMGPRLLPYEPRFRAAILLSGGFSPQAGQASIERVAALAGRVTLPVLMLGGADDFANPLSHQEALFRALGTPEDQKRFRAYQNAGHWPLPWNELIRETVEFLDRYAPRTGNPR